MSSSAFLRDTLTHLGALAYPAVWGMIFAESGLMVGFFLPGDSLLITVGILASQNYLNLGLMLVGCGLAAVLGDNVGYHTGHRWGRRLFERRDSRFFKHEYLERTEKFFAEHGRNSLILARFVAIVRTFAPIFAGIARMPYRSFLVYNFVGAVLWAVGLILLGYFLGGLIPPEQFEAWILVIVVVIVLASVIPAAWHLRQHRRQQKAVESQR